MPIKLNWCVVGHSLWAAAIGALFVVTILPLWMLVVPLWLAVLIETTRTKLAKRRRFDAMLAPLIEIKILVVIFSLASAAPMKREDRWRAQTIVLPKMQMTVQELCDAVASGDVAVPGLGLQWIEVPPQEQAKVIHWPAQRVTFNEFLNVVEQQTCLRHGLRAPCAMGYTLLWGNDTTRLTLCAPN